LQVERWSDDGCHRLHAVAAAHALLCLLTMRVWLHNPFICRGLGRHTHGQMARRLTRYCGLSRKRFAVHRHDHGEQSE